MKPYDPVRPAPGGIPLRPGLKLSRGAGEVPLTRSLAKVSVAHGMLLMALLIISGCGALLHRKTEYVAVQFTVAVPKGPNTLMLEGELAHPRQREQAPPPPPTPPRQVRRQTEPQANPQVNHNTTQRQTDVRQTAAVTGQGTTGIQKGPRIMRRSHPDGTDGPLGLSPREIDDLLKMGARPGQRTVVPQQADDRCMELIRRALYDAWAQPGMGPEGLTAEVKLRLLPGGAVRSSEITRRSGSPDFDASVEAAVRACRLIKYLTADFLQRHPQVTIVFVLGQE